MYASIRGTAESSPAVTVPWPAAGFSIAAIDRPEDPASRSRPGAAAPELMLRRAGESNGWLEDGAVATTDDDAPPFEGSTAAGIILVPICFGIGPSPARGPVPGRPADSSRPGPSGERRGHGRFSDGSPRNAGITRADPSRVRIGSEIDRSGASRRFRGSTADAIPVCIRIRVRRSSETLSSLYPRFAPLLWSNV